MSMVFIATGTATLGQRKINEDRMAIEASAAEFTVDDVGSCVAVGTLDPDTMEPKGNISVYGDWQASEYLKTALELLEPTRWPNIPDFKAVIQTAYQDGVDFCDYCKKPICRDCVINDWKQEIDEQER